MANQGVNLSFTNVHRFGRTDLRPHGSSTTMLACRRCNKVYTSARTLIEHYETHEDESVHQTQNHQRANISPYQRERSSPFHQRVAQSIIGLQRHHPYFPNGYQAMQQQARERNPIANNSSFLVPTQNPQPFQPRNYPVTGGITSQVVVNRPTETQNFQLGIARSSRRASLQQLVSEHRAAYLMRIQNQKGYDETADKRTIWYLGQLEKPIPKTIDLRNTKNSKLFPGGHFLTSVDDLTDSISCNMFEVFEALKILCFQSHRKSNLPSILLWYIMPMFFTMTQDGQPPPQAQLYIAQYCCRQCSFTSLTIEGITEHVNHHRLVASISYQSPHPMVPTQELRERNLYFNPYRQLLPSPTQPAVITAGNNSLQMPQSTQDAWRRPGQAHTEQEEQQFALQGTEDSSEAFVMPLLDQLNHPIQEVIDLESDQNGGRNNVNLSLRL